MKNTIVSFDNIMLDRKSIKLLKRLHPNRFYTNEQVKQLLHYGLIKINPIFEEDGDGVAQYDRTDLGIDYLKYLKRKPGAVFKKLLLWLAALFATLLITAVFNDTWNNMQQSRQHTEQQEAEYQPTNQAAESDTP